MDHKEFLIKVLESEGFTDQSQFDFCEHEFNVFVKCLDGAFTLSICIYDELKLNNVFFEWEDLGRTSYSNLSYSGLLVSFPNGIKNFMEYIWKAYDLRNDFFGIVTN